MSILSGLEANKKAVVLAGVDISKSFSRCLYQEKSNVYARLGLSDWGLHMHAAFLSNRKMLVKIGNIISDKQILTGGAVQKGSQCTYLPSWILDHNAVMEFVDDGLTRRNKHF